jgi:mannose-1-phosphate guanylyltransferase / mannose-6-phosphate isomerase
MMLKSKMLHVTPVILCGGSGSRLWPLSRKTFPKQFLVLSGKTTLFQQAVDRLQSLKNLSTNLNDILIVTNEQHRFLVLDQLREIKDIKVKILLEAVSRNTAPALTIAALQAMSDDEDPILVVSPSDQILQDQTAFKKSIDNAIQLAAEGSIVVLGVKPIKPETGFGYIQTDKVKGKQKEYKVLSFTEKPNITNAENYIKSGDYFWNSGMFVLRASIWLKAIKFFNIDIYQQSQKAFNQKTNDGLFVRPNELLFKEIPSFSIDYAVIEKCSSSNFIIKMIELDAGWNDLGCWDAVWGTGLKDENQNVIYGDVLSKNTSSSLIYSNHRLVVANDIKNLVIIETPDAVMIADRNQSQNIKEIVDRLKVLNREEGVFHRKVARPWGWYDNLDAGENFKVKRILVNPKESLSLQKHKKRAEHWVVVKGVAEIICGDKQIILHENESTYIPLGVKHRLSNPGQEILEIIEIQSGAYLDEDDIVRFEDNYGRA